jgi:hypothetical protein
VKKQQLGAVGLIILLAAAVAFFGRTDNQPRDGNRRIVEALKAREVPVVVITAGRDKASEDLAHGVWAAITGSQRTRFIRIDTLNPVEREAARAYPKASLPLVFVVGLDGAPAYQAKTASDAAAIKQAIATGLTRKPMEFPVATEGDDEHHH